MTPDQIAKANAELRNKSPLEIVKWAIAQAKGRAIVSTNFRPFEAVVLHLCVQAQPDIPVLWVDHGYNRPATYKHAEQLKKSLKLNLKPFLPKITAAHRDAIYGEIPSTRSIGGPSRLRLRLRGRSRIKQPSSLRASNATLKLRDD